MTPAAGNQSDVIRNLIEHCNAVQRQTLLTEARRDDLAKLTQAAADLHDFVYGLCQPTLPDARDDEILNWTFGDALVDLGSAIFLLVSGYHKASASSLRSALDVGMCALYFQIREEREPVASDWNKFFVEWDEGIRATPNWGEMRTYINQFPSVASTNQTCDVDSIGQVYDHFRLLSAFTHTRAWLPAEQAVTGSTSNSVGITAINTVSIAPAHDDDLWLRGVEMTRTTIAHLATVWLAAFPSILLSSPIGDPALTAYDELLASNLGGLVLAHARSIQNLP
ncbi:MAG: hypothetical protein WBB51_01350 [Candidatus Microthrix parvicella]|jgi:hypothetical protein|uniref:Uncharacterized protein n=1 Tax=Candidatus Neomicrothrix parvicella RN1 TaxID=1229780 RepID=R4Z7B9_9ACTN|nr:hypothetical protein [Candidatus Microthrix parvicella]CCM65262.1 hypothetical protein BN381_640009 [Candidatus Microthrix parvicella RN1]